MKIPMKWYVSKPIYDLLPYVYLVLSIASLGIGGDTALTAKDILQNVLGMSSYTLGLILGAHTVQITYRRESDGG